MTESVRHRTWVAARGPWHWERLLARPRSQASLDVRVAEAPTGWVWESSVMVEGQAVPVSVEGGPGGMAVRTAAPAAAHEAAVQAAAWRFATGSGDHAAAAFFPRAAADPVLQPLASRWWGIRPLRDASPWVALARLILGQQVSVASHRTLVNRLLTEWGTPLKTPTGAVVYAWPAPERLAGAAVEALAAGGIPQRPAATLQVAARWAAAGGLGGVSRDPEGVKRQLEALPGVGPWTAAGAALFGWGEDDAVMASDLVLAKAAAALTGPGERLSARALEQWLAPHRPRRAWVCYLLWHLRLPPVGSTGEGAPGTPRTLGTATEGDACGQWW